MFLTLMDGLGSQPLEAFYGGAAGGGKSEALLMGAAMYVEVPNYSALLLRRTFADLSQPGALISRSHEWWDGTQARWHEGRKEWLFPSGAKIRFGYMDTFNDKKNYYGAEYQYVGFDEATQFCLTPEHDVLTESGWKNITDVAVGEYVLSVSSDGVASNQRVSAVHEFPYDGDIVRVRTSRIHYDATPNHKVLLRTQRRKDWKLVEVKDLPHTAWHPRNATWVGEEVDRVRFDSPSGRGLGPNQNSAESCPADDWLEFLGWYLAEGCCFMNSTSPIVSIRQTRPAPDLDALMDRLPWRVQRSDGQYRIGSRQLYDQLKPLGNTYQKRVPRWIMKLPPRQLAIFFDAFARGDGGAHKNGSIAFGLANEGLVDDLQEIAIKLGRSSTKGYQLIRNQYPTWRLNVYNPNIEYACVLPKHRATVHHAGTVHCLSVENNHTFLARLNGRVFWSGNSEEMYEFFHSRTRRKKGMKSIPIRLRAASNPGDIGHEWVKQRFIIEGPQNNRIFVPAKLNDNPSLDIEGYRASLMQLNPVMRAQLLDGDWDVAGKGNNFKREWFNIVEQSPVEFERLCRYWDTAATAPAPGKESHADWTVGIKMGRLKGQYWILDIVRFQGNPGDVQRAVQNTAHADGEDCEIYMEQEPGASGKMMIEHYLLHVLSRYHFQGIRSTGPKTARAARFSAVAESRNIFIVAGTWLSAFFGELEAFPFGRHDDQVDAACGAYNQLAGGGELRPASSQIRSMFAWQ